MPSKSSQITPGASFQDTTSWSFAESDSPEVLNEEISKLLLPCPSGLALDDHVIAWHFVALKYFFWREDSSSWHRLTWKLGHVSIESASPAYVEAEAINFVALVDEATRGELFERRRGSSVVYLARRLVKVAKIYSKPGVPGFNQTEEFVRGWLTKVKDGVVGNHTAVPLRTFVISDDLFRLYRVVRAADVRAEKTIRSDLAGAIRTVFKIGRSNNLPSRKTGKPTVRGWWGLDFSKALPEGFQDVPADVEDGLADG